MDKETVKKIINDFIDSVDEIQDFSISNDVEEIDNSTLGGENIIRVPTGLTNVCITTYKKVWLDGNSIKVWNRKSYTRFKR